MSICATGIVIGAGSNDGTIRVWDARSSREVAALPQTNIVYAATPFTPDTFTTSMETGPSFRIAAPKFATQDNGYLVLRFLGEDLSKDLDGVLDAILRSLTFCQHGSF